MTHPLIRLAILPALPTVVGALLVVAACGAEPSESGVAGPLRELPTGTQTSQTLDEDEAFEDARWYA